MRLAGFDDVHFFLFSLGRAKKERIVSSALPLAMAQPS
jgi:hypothetical protein